MQGVHNFQKSYTLIIKTTEMHNFSNLFDNTCFGQVHCPSSGVSQINMRNCASRWLLLEEYITMHGHPNVKFQKSISNSQILGATRVKYTKFRGWQTAEWPLYLTAVWRFSPGACEIIHISACQENTAVIMRRISDAATETSAGVCAPLMWCGNGNRYQRKRRPEFVLPWCDAVTVTGTNGNVGRSLCSPDVMR